MTSPSLRAFALALPLTFIGCDGSAAQDPPAEGRFEVRVTEGPAGPGPFEGIHTAAGDLQCASTAGSYWTAGIAVEQIGHPAAFKEVVVLLTGVPASGGQTTDVNLGLIFGELYSDAGGTIGIGLANGGGSGTATVERRGRGAVIRVEGATFYGAGISAVIECGSVEVVR